ncbi:hypothetical protein BOTCAL_0161g00080 [Botryotinia calthae]|uniref:Uncharacterized protein n=1 Tax=Botryotinia calthae TaxID=38488 RepID=A0A4Y8D1V7_9HELO|nr:hypothetical protein BOTCAL_0161g00080 [Botryotinia calthae]
MLVRPDEMPELKKPESKLAQKEKDWESVAGRKLKNEAAIQRAAQQVKDRVCKEVYAQKSCTKKARLEYNTQDLINAARNQATEERANMKREEKHRARTDVALAATYTTRRKASRATKKRSRDAEE